MKRSKFSLTDSIYSKKIDTTKDTQFPLGCIFAGIIIILCVILNCIF